MAGKTLTTKIVFAGHDGVSSVLAGITAGVNRAADQMSRVGQRMSALGQQMSLAVGLPAAAALKSATDQAIKLENSSVELAKATNLIGEPFRALEGDLRGMADRVGMSFAEIEDAAASASKAGVPTDQLKEFVALSSRAASAWDIGQSEVADQLAVIRTALKLNNDGLAKVIDDINFAGDSTAAKIPDLLSVLKRTAGVSKTLGISEEMQSAFAASGLSAGIMPENMATSMNIMFGKLSKGTLGLSKTAKAAWKKVGLDPEKFRVDFGKDADAAIMKMLDKFKGFDGTKRKNIVTAILGENADDEILGVIDRLDEFKQTYESLDKGMSRGSALKEFQRAQATLDFAMKRMKNSWANLGAVIGGALSPDIKGIADAISNLNAQLTKSPALARAMGRALVAGVVVGPGLIALGMMTQGIAALMRLATVAIAPLSAMAKTVRLLDLAFFGSAKLAAVARGSLLAVGLAGAPLIAVLGSITAGAALLWRAWPKLAATIKAFDFSPTLKTLKDSFVALFDGNFNGAWAGLKRAFASVKPLLSNMAGVIATEWTAMLDNIDAAVPSFGPLRRAFNGVVAAASEFVSAIADLLQGNVGRGLATSLAKIGKAVTEAGFAAATATLDGFSAAVRTVAKAIRDFDAGGFKAMFEGLPESAKFLGFAAGMRMIGPALSLIATSAGTLRGFSLAGIVAGVGKINPLTLFAVGWGLAEMGKNLGLLNSSFNSEDFAVALASIPLAIQAAQGAIAGASAIAKWTGIGRAAGLAYAAGVRAAVLLGEIIAAAWQALSAVAAGLAGAIAGRAYVAGLMLSNVLGGAIATAWAGIGTASATTAGAAWGAAFGAAAALAIGAAVAAALQKFDPKGNLGGMTKPIDDWLRGKMSLPASDSGITPDEIWTGLGNLFSGAPTVESPKIETPILPSNVISLDEAWRARTAGVGGSTTDTLPGKTKDDLGIGLESFRSQSLSEARRAADVSMQTKSAVDNQTNTLAAAIGALAGPLGVIASNTGALKGGIKVMGMPAANSTKTEGATPTATLNSRGKMNPGAM